MATIARVLAHGALAIVVAAATTPPPASYLSLTNICKSSYARAALPNNSILPGITIDPASVETTLVNNASVSSDWFPTATITYCNVTFAYSHNGIANDKVHVTYWLPSPSTFKNRYVSTGGGGLAINSGTGYIPTGVIVGAVSGITDGGFGNFNTQWDAVFLESEGVINWQATKMFGYQAHHELAVLGKELSRNVYKVTSKQKVYSYYQGCSEGGREGWSQLQRFADQFDGAAIGAPAIRYAQQQVNHLSGNVIEQTMDYYPPSCELDKIAELMIAACDPLDGKADGIVSRSDLCKLHFNINSTIGTPYSCEASGGTGPGGPGGPPSRRQVLRRQFPPSNPTPAQNGTITPQGAAVASAFLDGLFSSTSPEKRVYLPWPYGATLADAATAYDATTATWGPSISGLGGEWVARFLQLHANASTLASIEGVTYDTLLGWMQLGMDKYGDILQTTVPDLRELKKAGAKVLHVHGEQDNSIPPASSVRYYESVRKVLYPGVGFNESVEAMDAFYRFYLVPGAGHCGPNSAQPGSPWPQRTLQTVIDWVEKGAAPDRLAATGDIETICRWPLRPMWTEDGVLNCEYDQASIDSWVYDLNAWDEPIY